MIEQFCKSILQLGIRKSKALANLVMGLSSQFFARSVVEVSLSSCYHYQYSSINKAIDAIYSKEEKGAEEKTKGSNEKRESRLEVEKKFIH